MITFLMTVQDAEEKVTETKVCEFETPAAAERP